MGKIIEYEHHGNMVKVDESLKGKHRDCCLCFICDEFIPENRDANCTIANKLFSICCEFGMTTPVFECKYAKINVEKAKAREGAAWKVGAYAII